MCLYTVTRVYIVYAIDVVLFKNTIPVPSVCTLFRPLMSFLYNPIPGLADSMPSRGWREKAWVREARVRSSGK